MCLKKDYQGVKEIDTNYPTNLGKERRKFLVENYFSFLFLKFIAKYSHYNCLYKTPLVRIQMLIQAKCILKKRNSVSEIYFLNNIFHGFSHTFQILLPDL